MLQAGCVLAGLVVLASVLWSSSGERPASIDVGERQKVHHEVDQSTIGAFVEREDQAPSSQQAKHEIVTSHNEMAGPHRQGKQPRHAGIRTEQGHGLEVAERSYHIGTSYTPAGSSHLQKLVASTKAQHRIRDISELKNRKVHKILSGGRRQKFGKKDQSSAIIEEGIDGHGQAAVGGQGPAVTVKHESWVERMGGAFAGVIIGIIMIFFSFPVLWMNERRNARLESLVALGEKECINICCADVLQENRGCLVHATSEVRAVEQVQDQFFDKVVFDKGIVRLRSIVEAFQWVEHSASKTEKDSLGGGATTTTSYTYTKEWRTERIDSATFRTSGHDNKLAIKDLDPCILTQNSSRVDFGEGFYLASPLVDQMGRFETASARIGPSVTFNTTPFNKSDDNYYYYPSRGAGPEVGDMRAAFEVVPDGPATVLALQVETDAPAKYGKRDTFIPYRLISRGLCGISRDEQKKRQLTEGRLTEKQLFEQDRFACGPLDGICVCCICICNCVVQCFSGLMAPEIFHLFDGDVSGAECWRRVRTQGTIVKWIIRIIGWALLFCGTFALFQPLIVMLDVIPYIGPYIGTAASYGIWVICFLVTVVIATTVIGVAYLIYRPLVGLCYLGVALFLATIPTMLAHHK